MTCLGVAGVIILVTSTVVADNYTAEYEHSENDTDTGLTSSAPATSLQCYATFYPCKNNYKCVSRAELCDGFDDCLDGSDEDLTECIRLGKISPSLFCSSVEFKCKNGFKCTPLRYLCDGDNDCRDWSDENPLECISVGIYEGNVTCSDIGFECPEGNGTCISRKQLCDGKNDCGDNTDEDIANCIWAGRVPETLSCEDMEFACKNGFKCIAKRYMCDARNDCYDGSDEDPVECIREGILEANVTCNDLGFECRNTSYGGSFCIGNLLLCDGRDNCGDNSDEDPSMCAQRTQKPRVELLPWFDQRQTVHATCGTDHFRCTSASYPACIKKRYLCDSQPDCMDGSDEYSAMCSGRNVTLHCGTSAFKCANNRKCIMRYNLCDGINNCGDRSDETAEACVLRSAPTTTIRPAGAPVVCRTEQFKCADGHQCIRKSALCDGINTCADGSDEVPPACIRTTPAPLNCSTSEFRCKNNRRCVPLSYLCDRDNDCGDRSDEDYGVCHLRPTTTTTTPTPVPHCAHNQFRCSDGRRCILNSYVCDKQADCLDRSDEDPATCNPKPNCRMGEFMCKNALKCVPVEYLCDGDNDCTDGSDEAPNECSRPVTPQVNYKGAQRQNAAAPASLFGFVLHISLLFLFIHAVP